MYFVLAHRKTQDTDDTTGLENFQYSPDSLGDLQDLAVKVSAKWKAIARCLEVPENTIESIDMQYRSDGTDECLMKVFDWWKRKGVFRYAWSTIIRILEKPAVGHSDVAKHLRQTLDHRPPDPSA